MDKQIIDSLKENGIDIEKMKIQLGGREEFIIRLYCKFLKDENYSEFQKRIREENYKEAFRAVHNLKGISANLCFTELYRKADQIVCILKAKDFSEINICIQELDKSYHNVIDAIRDNLVN